MTHSRAPLRRLSPFALAVAALASASAAAQAVGDQRVEIIGTTPLPGVGVPRDQVPANVQSATAAEIEGSHANDLSSFLARRLGSVHLNETQNNPFQPDLNYRGFTASPLLGTPQGLSVYLDGVRLNQPFGDVVSWDLVPRSAIAGVTLNPGSNPLFGLNTLGGALVVQTKDGLRNPGVSAQVIAGQHKRAAAEFEAGAPAGDGWHWFATGNRFHDGGWRDSSPTDVTQVYGKVGRRAGGGDYWLAASGADNKLTGNGLQEMNLLARDWSSVYTKPDETRNRALGLTAGASQSLGETWSVSGLAYWRRIRTGTYNGDANDISFDQSVYQPNAADIAALTDAGYTGFPTSGANASNTPFPYWRCIAQALQNDEPAEKCTGVINRTQTRQSNWGLSAQLSNSAPLGALPNLFVAGAALDANRVHFVQGSELGYVNPDRSVTGVGAFGDGVSGGNVDGEPYDTRVDLASRSRTWSVFASDSLTVAAQTVLTLSGRYNRTTMHNRDAIIPGGGPGSLDSDIRFSRLNPALGLTFAPAAGLSAFAGYSEGSRAPSAVELGCADPLNPCKLPNAFAGDPPLKQVVARTIEFGLRSAGRGELNWNAGIFRTDNRDDILFVADNASGAGYFKNFGRTRRQGLEAGLNTRVGPATLGFNYTYLQATYRSAETIDGSSNSSNDAAAGGFPGVDGTIDIRPGDRIAGQPRQMVKLFGDLALGESFSIGADLAAFSGALARGNENGQHQPDGVYYLGPGRNPGYAVLNFNAEYKPTAGLKFFTQVENVFDRRYTTAAQLGATGFDNNGNFLARPFPADANGDRPLRQSTFFAPGAPRTFWVGLRMTFGG
ncbi:MAG: TonB-dependent receptor [Rubrivivax sp.]